MDVHGLLTGIGYGVCLMWSMSHDCLSMDLVVGCCLGGARVHHIMGSILFANHKANGVVTNIGLSS